MDVAVGPERRLVVGRRRWRCWSPSRPRCRGPRGSCRSSGPPPASGTPRRTRTGGGSAHRVCRRCRSGVGGVGGVMAWVRVAAGACRRGAPSERRAPRHRTAPSTNTASRPARTRSTARRSSAARSRPRRPGRCGVVCSAKSTLTSSSCSDARANGCCARCISCVEQCAHSAWPLRQHGVEGAVRGRPGAAARPG